MWEHTEKSVVRNILSRYLDNDASDLAMRYFDVIKTFETAQLSLIAKAYNDLLTGFRGNTTFERHGSSLSPMMVHGFTSWVAFLSDSANFNEDTASNSDKGTLATSRNQFKDVAIMIYSLTVRDADVNRMRKELLACKEL
jgi:hypothetical protein